MTVAMETVLTAREASFVADVGYRRIVKAFENRRVESVSGRARMRRLNVRGVLSVAVAERLKLYPTRVQERIQGQVDATIGKARALSEVRDVMVADYLVVTTFKAAELARLVEGRLEKLERLRELVVTDPRVQAGAPTFKGTRILVRHVAELVRNAVGRQEVAEDFPEITDEMLDLAVLFDRLYPQKGRPGADAGYRVASAPLP